jgi:FMN reductase
MTEPLRIVGVSGSLREPSKTTALVRELIDAVAEREEVRARLIEVATLGPLFAGALRREDLQPEVEDALRAIEAADLLIVASPVYRASFTGLFKHLFDFVDPAALAGRPVILTATGGGRRHALVVEHQLRPLFGFFSALTVPTSIYASDEDFENGKLTDPVTLGRMHQAAAELAALAGTSASRPLLGQVA